MLVDDGADRASYFGEPPHGCSLVLDDAARDSAQDHLLRDAPQLEVIRGPVVAIRALSKRILDRAIASGGRGVAPRHSRTEDSGVPQKRPVTLGLHSVPS